VSGYADPAYAASLSEWGQPRGLPGCGGHLLVRQIDGSDALDAMGPYPLFACRNWPALSGDIAELRPDMVAVSLVTDPFANADQALLHKAFPDLCVRFKDHFVVDLQAPDVEGHHRRNTRKALGGVCVRDIDPASALDDWVRLYGVLVERHGVTGPQRFSRAIFEKQLAAPGMKVLAAMRDDAVVGMTLWLQDGEVAYYHLGAYSAEGYEVGASFALFATAIEVFREKARWLSLGAGAGATDADDGLTRFKRGWGKQTRPTFLCGRILNAKRYAALSAGRSTAYFPAYRAGEFA
jgi:hypothetical protein